MAEGKIKFGVEARFAFIEWRAFWHGRFNRADLMERFGLSQTQASMDLRAYQELAPANLIYDGTDKTYRCADGFVPRFGTLSADSYLTPLLSMSAGVIDPATTWFRTLPPFLVSPTPARGVKAEILRPLIQAVDHGRAIEVCYQSMSSPDPSWRWIEPHAYAFDGFRWHVRAWCKRSLTFKDFLLSRILEVRVGEYRPAESDRKTDLDWFADVSLVIAPHPDLSEAQRRSIALDYEMDADNRAIISVKRALLYYTLKRLGLDIDPSARKPQDQQIVLLNREDVLGLQPTKEFR